MSVNTTWARIDFGDLIPTDELLVATEGLRAVVSAMQASVAAASASAAITAAAAGIVIDPAQELLAAALEVFDAAIETLVETSVGVLVIPPGSGRRNEMGPSQLLRKYHESRFDYADQQRPIARSDDTAFITLGIFVPYDSVGERELWAKIARLFGRDALSRDTRPMSSRFIGAPLINRGTGQLPDWESKRLGELGLIGALVNKLLLVRPLFTRSVSAVTAVQQMIASLELRAQTQLDIIDEIIALLEELGELLGALSQAYILAIEGSGNTITQANSVVLARYAEDYPFTADPSCAAVFLHVQSASTATVSSAKRLFGIGDDLFSERRWSRDALKAKISAVTAAQRADLRRLVPSAAGG